LRGETDRSCRIASAPGGGSAIWWYIRIGTRALRSTPSGVGSKGVGVGVFVGVSVGVDVGLAVFVGEGVKVGV